MRVLLVEDDKALRRATAAQLRSADYLVDEAAGGEDGAYYLAEGGYDAVLLDRMLPGRDGLALLREMRGRGDETPVLLLTALDAVGDRVDGLDAGADDYLAKPFDMRELLARLRALCRRSGAAAPVLRYGDVCFSPASLTLTGGLGACTLARKEGELLEYLLRQNGEAAPRHAILARLWGAGSGAADANLDSYAYYVRRRLAAVSRRVRLATVRGVGYRLTDAEAEP